MKRKLKDLSNEQIKVTLDALYTAASVMKGRADVKLFLRDLLTPSERIMLGRRIIIARMLLRGVLAGEIARELGVGTGTIWRVQKWLGDQFPGYENIIKEVEKEFDRRFDASSKEPLSITRLKKKYPLHFLLVPKSKRAFIIHK